MKIARLSLYAFFAVFLLVVSCGKDEGDPDPNTKPTSKTQAQRVKDLQNSILLGISYSDLKKEGYTLDEFLLAEVSVEDILTAGFTLSELLEEDEITIAELKSNGITLQQLYDADVPVGDLWKAGYSVNELLAIDGIDIADLKSGNVPLHAILDAGQSVQAAFAGGFTVNELLEIEGITLAYLKSNNISLADLFVANVPVSDLWNAGFGVSELLALEGVGVSELKSGGVPVKSMYDAGVSVDDLISGGYSMIELLSLDEVTLQVFIQQGYTLEDFIEGGVSVDDLWNAGYTALQLYEAGMPLIDIFNKGTRVGTLREFGATENELKTAGLIGSVNDIDNNNYSWVRIGNQIWMGENLRTTKNSKGEGVTSLIYLDSLELENVYGRLYKNSSLSYSKLCPTGWRIPSKDDWGGLISILGPDIAILIKEKGTEHWAEGNTGSNESGFSARGAGWYDKYDRYQGLLNGVIFGSTTRSASSNVYVIQIGLGSGYDLHIENKDDYSYVRCMKNAE